MVRRRANPYKYHVSVFVWNEENFWRCMQWCMRQFGSYRVERVGAMSMRRFRRRLYSVNYCPPAYVATFSFARQADAALFKIVHVDGDDIRFVNVTMAMLCDKYTNK